MILRKNLSTIDLIFWLCWSRCPLQEFFLSYLRNSYVYVSLRILESDPEFFMGNGFTSGFWIRFFYGSIVLHCASRVLEEFFMDPWFCIVTLGFWKAVHHRLINQSWHCVARKNLSKCSSKTIQILQKSLSTFGFA